MRKLQSTAVRRFVVHYAYLKGKESDSGSSAKSPSQALLFWLFFYQLIYSMRCMCGRSILNLLHRSSCKKGLEKSSKQCRHLLTKIPSCSIFWSIVSLALHTANVPMILCFLIPSSIFLNSICQMSRLQSKN
jgi:hypothetical protein